VVCTIGHEKQRTKTHQGGGKKPQWYDTLQFQSNGSFMKVEVYDDDFGKDDFIGEGTVNLTQLTSNPMRTENEYVDIICRGKSAGRVLISMEYQGQQMGGNTGGWNNNQGGWGNQPNQGGWGNQPNQGGWGNQPNQGGWGNQPNQGGWGNQPNQGGWGNGPNQGGWGNQPNQGGWGNQPNQGGWGNQPNQGGWGNQPNQGGWNNNQGGWGNNPNKGW